MVSNIFMVWLLLWAAYFFGIYMGHEVPKPAEINWVENAPLATHVHKDKICFEWQGKYKTQVVSCIKRGN